MRISLLEDKDKLGHHGEKPNWSKKLYIVTKILHSSRGPKRYKVREDQKVKEIGPFFRDRLLAVQRPTHALNQKSKYAPGQRKAGDVKREKAAMRPDLAPKIKWANQQTYKDAQDVREDSGDEYAKDVKVKVKPKRNKPRMIKAKKVKMIGRLVYVHWGDGVEDKHRATLIERYKTDWIVYFKHDKSIGGFIDDEITRLTSDFVTEKFVKDIKRKYAKEIATVKKETDAAAAT